MIMGHFTAIGMRVPVVDHRALVINTCGQNDSAERGSPLSWVWSNPTNRAITHIHPNDPAITAVSVECMWQGTKILPGMTEPNQTTLMGNWRGGKAKRPIGAWNGPGKPLITNPGEARVTIYLPAFRNLIEHWMRDPVVDEWVRAARNHDGNVYLRDHDTGRGVWSNHPMSHAWVLATWLNTSIWPI